MIKGYSNVAMSRLALGTHLGDALKNHSVKEALEFALNGTDHVIVGSKNVKHIEEVLQYV